ncbi:MFS transporter [Streptomyces sp. NPDC093225]|uniref:MFS transporter n=1 Tax=Streptomyces sp. NPDC093225 TaxID=3366034 RepID=UPI00380535ED
MSARRERGPGLPGPARFLCGLGLSLAGDQMWFVALGWTAARWESPLRTTAVMACASVPRAVLLLVGGTLADRYGPLRVVRVSQLLRTALMAAAALGLWLAGGAPLALLAATAVAFGVLDAAHVPATSAAPTRLVPRAELPRAQGAVQAVQRTAGVLGAPAGGAVTAFAGPAAATALVAAFFALSLTLLRHVRDRPAAPPPRRHTTPRGTADHTGRQAVAAGVRYAVREPVVGRVLVVVAVLNLALAAPLNVGLALLSAERGWGPAGYSVTVSAFAAGAVAGALFSARRGGRPRAAAAGLGWVAAGGACLALCPLAPSLVPVLALTAALGFTTGPATALLFGLVQARTHEHYTGRVSALAGFASLGLAPVSYAAFGSLAGAIGLTPAFEACAAATLTTAALTWTNRSVRTATPNTPVTPGTPGTPGTPELRVVHVEDERDSVDPT